MKNSKDITMIKYIFTVLILSKISLVFGEDLSSCTLKKKSDEQNFCKASFAGSATFCDMIQNGEKKRECYFMVVKIQRDNAYQLKNTSLRNLRKTARDSQKRNNSSRLILKFLLRQHQSKATRNEKKM